MEDFYIFLLIGFFAQLVDAALGMAYGVISTTLLLSFGFPPVIASATTHAAECLTTGFSALAHHKVGNVNPSLFKKLLIPGLIGGVLGALLLVHLNGEAIRPFIAVYLLIMGIIVITKAFRVFPPYATVKHLIPLGFFGAFIDAIGGGGWGPIVTSTLLARGNDVRTTIGSVNATEFFIAFAVSSTFLLSGTDVKWQVLAALAIGGAVASPIGAIICKYVPVKILLFVVGSLIMILSGHMLWKFLNLYGA